MKVFGIFCWIEDDLRCFAAGSLQEEEDLSEGQGKHSLGPTCSAPLAVQ